MSVQGSDTPRQESYFLAHVDASRSSLDMAEASASQQVEGFAGRPRKSSGLVSLWQAGEPVEARVTPSRQVSFALKRGMDIVGAIMALAFLAPLLLIVAACIKISDRGPVLFTQDRVGRGGKTFKILKFRSMYRTQCSPDGVDQTVENDPRIMPFGNFIRRTSIDELPQLLNVLRGDMSLVGPRPHVAGQLAAGVPYDVAVPFYHYRHQMRPGLTGWAQANGYRGPTIDPIRARLRIEHDVAYIQNFSLALDFKIAFLTMRREFLGGNGF